jgi:hypothetical protein
MLLLLLDDAGVVAAYLVLRPRGPLAGAPATSPAGATATPAITTTAAAPDSKAHGKKAATPASAAAATAGAAAAAATKQQAADIAATSPQQQPATTPAAEAPRPKPAPGAVNATVKVNPGAPLTVDQAREVVDAWIGARGAALGAGHEVGALRGVLRGRALQTWQRRAEDLAAENRCVWGGGGEWVVRRVGGWVGGG